MKGDFTRGIQPDRKRGKRYRRVLVQQSRVLLDSDAAALVDSIDRELRQVTADLGCRLGSPDLGYLITPGRLLALFERNDGVSAGAPATAMRDYQRKYPEAEGRYPSLRIEGVAAGTPPGAPGTVTIPLIEPLAGPVNGQLAIWYRADAAVTISVTAGTATTTSALRIATSWTREVAAVAVADGATLREITITGDPSAPVWIGLVELHEDRGPGPHFWAAAGRYHVEGLTPTLAAATGYPEVSYPASAGFPTSEPAFALDAPQPSIVAYLETWERDITAAEDPGIREVALGKADTTVRTEVIGQVKWAVAGALTPPELRRAFRLITPPSSELVVSAPTTAISSDPCALPTSGGYTGADHRLYRFEVHEGGAPTVAQIKWSRDNAAHVFAVREIESNKVTLDRNCGLLAGDIVEVLSEVVDLGDADLAMVTATGVTLATRRVGMLARLKQEQSDSQGRDVFLLLDRTNPAVGVDPATAPERYPAVGGQRVPLRLRRWDGVATPEVSGAEVVAKIEDGIEIRIAGTFQPGEYWQYEARRGASNDNGPWRARPHGPERTLAPLALLDVVAAPEKPLFLRAWLDDRFSPLCELDADDVEFDGERVGTDADTVQEALENLYERDAGNCSDATLGPNGRTGDDATRIMAAINATVPPGGHLTLEPGVYDIRSPIVISKDVVIRGCPEATLLAYSGVSIFEITATGRLRIEQLILYNGPTGSGGTALVLLDGGGRLAAREVGFLAAASSAAIQAPNPTLVQPDYDASDDPVIDPDNLPPREDLPARVDLEDCVVIAPVGIVATYLASLAAVRTAFVFGAGGISAPRIEQLLVTDCSFRDGLPGTFFGSKQPELIRGQTDELLDTAAALPAGDGCAIAVTELLGGNLERNHQSCNVGIWARVGRDLAIRDDEFGRRSTPTCAIRIHHARRIDVEGGRYTAYSPIEVPLSARQVTVRRCQIVAQSGLAGISIAAEPVSVTPVVGITIDSNHITTEIEGIAVGQSATTQLDDIRITRNIVRVTSTIGWPAIAAAGDGPTSTVVIEANDLTTTYGIALDGAGGVIRGNRIRITDGIGIASGGRLGPLVVAENTITGSTKWFWAIYLYKAPDVRVTGNQVRSTAPPDSPPIALYLTGADSSQGHCVTDNDFRIGGTYIYSAHNLHLVGNRLQYTQINSGTAGQNGVIHGNQFGVDGGWSGDWWGLRGMWKISDNLASALVRIEGATHQEPIRWSGLLSDALSLRVPREGTAGARLPLVSSMPPRAGELADAGSALVHISSAAERALVAPLRDFLFENDVFVNSVTVADPFDFHVSGNRFGELYVSSNNLSTSTLHAVDNKVTSYISVPMDVGTATGVVPLDNVVALNSADTLYGPAYASTAINTPNLDR